MIISSPPFESLRRALLREGVPPRYARRYIAELLDHYHMLVKDNQTAGLLPEEASFRAHRELGNEVTLLRSVVDRRRVFVCSRGRPEILFIFLPIPMLYAAKALILLLCILIGMLLNWFAAALPDSMHGLRAMSHLCLDYAAPFIAALLCCGLAYQRGYRPAWALFASVLIGVCAGCVQFEMQQPMLQVAGLRAGIGVFSLTLAPMLLVPLVVYAGFEVLCFRRQRAMLWH